jgi:uncharacterized Zn-binding protein involved in type VI secretion
MKILGWIRVGDRAACGGIVTEGYDKISYDGIAYSHQDAKINCSQACVIVEAASFYRLPNGKAVPYHGHRTSGGCPLHSTINDLCGYATDDAEGVPTQYVSDGCGGWKPCSHDSPFDLSFQIRNARTGQPMSNMSYRIELDDGRSVVGCTDATGQTMVIHSDHPSHATLTIPYYGNVSTAIDPGMGSNTCDC